MDTLAKRLKFSLKRAEMTQSELARRVGVTQQSIQALCSGTAKKSVYVVDMAFQLGVRAKWLRDGTGVIEVTDSSDTILPDSEERIYIRGVVCAGDWIDASEMQWSRDDWKYIDMTSDEYLDEKFDDRFPRGERFGLLVKGASMNEWYPPGSVVICINPMRLRYEIAHGDHVVVRVTREDGKIEVTIKEAILQNGEWWLWPRSSDPDYQQPIRAGDIHNGEEDAEVFVLGVVVNAHSKKELKGKFRK